MGGKVSGSVQSEAEKYLAAKKSASPKARTSKPRRLFVRTGGGAGAYDLIGSHHALAVPVRSFSEGRFELI